MLFICIMFGTYEWKFIVWNRSRYTDHQTIGIFRLKKYTQKINKNKKLAVSDCRKHKMALPELGQKMAVSDCRKNKMAVPNPPPPKKKEKWDLLAIGKRYYFLQFSFFLFFSFLFTFLFLILFFLRREKKKKTKRVEEKEEGFPPGPVSLYKK